MTMVTGDHRGDRAHDSSCLLRTTNTNICRAREAKRANRIDCPISSEYRFQLGAIPITYSSEVRLAAHVCNTAP